MTECPAMTGAIRVERAERSEANTPGTVEGTTVMRQNVTILNLSRSGCLIQATAELAVGEAIAITIPRVGQRGAHVRRMQDDCYGCSFDQLLHPADVAAACAPPEEMDVAAVRRRIRDAVEMGRTETQEEPRSIGSRLRSSIRRIGRRDTPDRP